MGWPRAELWLRLVSGPLQVFAVTTTGFCTAQQKSGLPLLGAETQILVFGHLSCIQMLQLILEELVRAFLCSGPCLTQLVCMQQQQQHFASCPAVHVVTMTFLCFPLTPFFALWWCGSGAPFDLVPTWLVPLCDRH